MHFSDLTTDDDKPWLD